MVEHKHPENIPRARCVQNCKSSTEKKGNDNKNKQTIANLLFYDFMMVQVFVKIKCYFSYGSILLP